MLWLLDSNILIRLPQRLQRAEAGTRARPMRRRPADDLRRLKARGISVAKRGVKWGIVMEAGEYRFRGHRFHSRTEARWAVFFDEMGFRWEHEERRPQDGQTGPYQPNFKIILPDERIFYCCVQSEADDDFDDSEMGKLREFADASGHRVLHLTSTPDYRAYHQYIPNRPPNSLSLAFFQDYEPYVQTVDDYWSQYLQFDERTGRFYFPHDERQAGKSFGKGMVKAVEAAKKAQFEDGKSI